MDVNELMDSLIVSRRLFELNLYDYLVTAETEYLTDFWEPIKVALDKKVIIGFKKIYEESECSICCTSKFFFREMPCCKQKFCINCINTWFTESVKCPFCKQDIREIT